MFKTKCRPAVDDGNSPVNADNSLYVQNVCKIAEIKAILISKDTSSTVADSSKHSTTESSRNRNARCLFTLPIRL